MSTLRFVCTLLSLTCGTITAQPPIRSCLAPDAEAAGIVNYAKLLVSEASLEDTRIRYGLDVVAQSEIEIIQAPNLCSEAGAAYASALNGTQTRQVHVVRVGTRYIVVDPEERVGEFLLYMVFDSTWHRLASFAS